MVQKINEYLANSSEDGYFGITNLGGFTAAIYVSYKYNGEVFSYGSGIITLFLYREIKIPAGATDVHLYALMANGLAQWTPVYNNNFLTTPIVELKLSGTIWSPYTTIIKDPNLAKTRILATNSAGFITRYTVKYTCGDYLYDMESADFSLGISREIAIPNSAINISISAEYFTGINWVTFYNNNIPKPNNVDLKFSGTTSNPQYEEKITPPLSSGNGTMPKKAILLCGKKPHKNKANLNDVITFGINISNHTSTPAINILFKENLSKELSFIPDSFKVNGIVLKNADISFPINLDDIQKNSSIFITYKVKIIAIPPSKQIVDVPTLSFSYVDENNNLVNSTSTGSVRTLYVGKKF